LIGGQKFVRACNVGEAHSKSQIALVETLDQQLNLERFGELVLADRSLHDQLRAAPNEPAFIELAIRLAAERQLELTAPALQTAINQKRRAWLEKWL
jgi:hypothetical protein